MTIHPMPRRLRSSLVGLASVVACALHALPASAQPDPNAPPAPPVVPPPPPPAPPPSPPPTGAATGDEPAEPTARGTAGNRPNDVRFLDAHADRVIFGSTAETHPKGTFFFSDYEILLLQFGYAVTDDLQLSLTGLPPIVKDQPYFFDFGAKLNVVRGDVFRAALTGAFDVVTAGGTGTDNGPYYGGRLGAAGQFCFEMTCGSSVSISGGTIITSGIKQVFPIYGAVGFIAKLSPLVSLLAEPQLLGALGTGSGNVDSGGFFSFGYGVRLSGKHFGVDITFIKPVAVTGGGSFNDPFILGYPFVAFTYRTAGDPRDPRGANAQSARSTTGAANGGGVLRRF